MFQNIRYDSRTDPDQYTAMFLENLLAPLLQQHQLRQQQGDIGRLRPFAQGDMQGPLPQTKTPFGQDILTQLLFNQRQPTMGGLRMQEYFNALAGGDKERADKLLMPSLVNLDFGKDPYFLKGASPQEAEKFRRDYRKKQLEGTVEPLSDIELGRKATTMNEIIDKVGRKRLGANFARKDLLKAWDTYKRIIKYDKLPPDHQDQIWRLWNYQIENRNRKTDSWIQQRTGLSRGEYDWDPQDPVIQAAAQAHKGTESQAKPERTATEAEIDALIEEFKSDEAAIRKAAKERGLIIPQ